MIYSGRFYVVTKPFVRAICEAGANQSPRLAFADWLYEHGYNNEAFGEQWIARHGKWQDSTQHILGGWFLTNQYGEQHWLPRYINEEKLNRGLNVVRHSNRWNLLIGEYLLLYCLKQLTPEQYV